MEEVDGQWLEKSYVTLRHSSTQAALAARWLAHSETKSPNGQVLGGKVLTEALCQTQLQKRRPDVAYVTDGLLNQYGYPICFPVSFPLIAEVASPDDPAEVLFAKAYEYLVAGTQEVWLLYPESRIAIAVTSAHWQIFTAMDTLATQTELPGFAIALANLFP
jgi:Uma2 family endonuclease